MTKAKRPSTPKREKNLRTGGKAYSGPPLGDLRIRPLDSCHVYLWELVVHTLRGMEPGSYISALSVLHRLPERYHVTESMRDRVLQGIRETLKELAQPRDACFSKALIKERKPGMYRLKSDVHQPQNSEELRYGPPKHSTEGRP